MRSLDLAIVVLYALGVAAFGAWFYRRSRTPEAFTRASGSLPSLAVGLSIFGTFLSSNTFLGNPGKAYGSNWNSFVFSLSVPLAALVAVKLFVPFYRSSGYISAYTHLEARFGRWARTYACVFYLLTQLARVGAILLGVSLVLGPLTGLSPSTIILVTGALVTLYTLLGGIEAVIWTDVAQSLLLLGGAVVCAFIITKGTPGGLSEILRVGMAQGKLSLGSFGAGLSESTFWVVLLYGFLINLNNFGIDQSYVQRYHTARSTREAARAVWTAAWLYAPVSLLFFLIGTALYVFYGSTPGLLPPGTPPDGVFPHFIVNELPVGLTGLLVAALVAAAMSSVDTSLNGSATVIVNDLYRAYIQPQPSERVEMKALYASTLATGGVATAVALSMVGVSSLLDTWWVLSGIFASAMLGLFLLGMLERRADRVAALVAVAIGCAVIAYLTFGSSTLHDNLTIVVGTSVTLGVGSAVARLRARRQV